VSCMEACLGDGCELGLITLGRKVGDGGVAPELQRCKVIGQRCLFLAVEPPQINLLPVILHRGGMEREKCGEYGPSACP
jgi:hypothetical protein